MKKITALSAAQIERFAEYRDKWIAIGLSTAPANRAEAERGILEAYDAAKIARPTKIIWCGSPLSQGLTRAVLISRSVGASVMASVRASVGASVRDSVMASVGASVWDSVWDSVGASVWDSVWDSVGASVMASVGDSVWANVRTNVRASVWDSVWDSAYGQHDAGWLAFYEYFSDVCGLKDQTRKLIGLWRLARNAGWALPHEKICWISERHNILKRDERGRLHSLSGPALAYPDGWSIYAVHGVRVPEWVIERPQEINAKKIEAEANAEVRRVMIDRMGAAAYLRDSGARLIQQDECGKLWRKELQRDEPLQMVEVLNSTPEPDGSIKTYWLRVPPQMTTAHEAVAWTFGKKPGEYRPEIET